MTSEAEFRASLPPGGDWSIERRGDTLVATDKSGQYSPQYLDTRTGSVSSRTSGGLSRG